MNKLKLLLVEDQNLVRIGICSLLEISGCIDVVAQLEDGLQVIDALKKNQPDIMLLDIRMPQMDGIEVLEAMHAQNMKIPTLMLTTFDEHELVLKCIKLGALGYMQKDVSLEKLMSAINTVAKGERWVQPAVTLRVTDKAQKNSREDFISSIDQLTQSEIEVLRLVAAGYSNQEISEMLHKSCGTIRNTVSILLSKLGVRDRTRAALKAIESGLI